MATIATKKKIPKLIAKAGVIVLHSATRSCVVADTVRSSPSNSAIPTPWSALSRLVAAHLPSSTRRVVVDRTLLTGIGSTAKAVVTRGRAARTTQRMAEKMQGNTQHD